MSQKCERCGFNIGICRSVAKEQSPACALFASLGGARKVLGLIKNQKEVQNYLDHRGDIGPFVQFTMHMVKRIREEIVNYDRYVRQPNQRSRTTETVSDSGADQNSVESHREQGVLESDRATERQLPAGDDDSSESLSD